MVDTVSALQSTSEHATVKMPHLRPGAQRWTWSSIRYDRTIAFYRDLIGLPVLESFVDSFGEDGTILGLPDASTHLEILRADDGRDDAGWANHLVLYLHDQAAVDAATGRLSEAGLSPDPDPHPYWVANSATVYRDPDARQVVFAPWVYGRDTEPSDAEAHSQVAASQQPAATVSTYTGDRAHLRPLFEEAEDSSSQLDRYIDDGVVLVARQGNEILGHLQLVATGQAGTQEVKNMAVIASRRGAGLGTRLLDTAVARCRADGTTHLVVATAAADIGNLRFYQRCGFRITAIEPDAFTPAHGYPDQVVIDGIALRDRVWLTKQL